MVNAVGALNVQTQGAQIKILLEFTAMNETKWLSMSLQELL